MDFPLSILKLYFNDLVNFFYIKKIVIYIAIDMFLSTNYPPCCSIPD